MKAARATNNFSADEVTIMAWLCEMLTAGTFVADKGNVRQADTVATAEDLIKAWWHSMVISLPVPFVLESNPAGIFKGGDNVVGSEMPDIMVLS